ncbi:MAG: hypothetical protein HZB32_03885 [Nitrospirae bacterium]|nr:hypothetical protein [Nitrospirota bacterium]
MSNILPHLKGLPVPVKVLFTSFFLTVGIAYIFALLYLYLLDVEPHRGVGMGLLQATIHKYYGNRGDTRLEKTIRGTMGERLSPDEKKEISLWIREGATTGGFLKVKPIFDQNCTACHRPGSGLIPLTTYEEVRAITGIDLGESIRVLSRVSHIHLFGMSFIFILTGIIFSLSEIHLYLKTAIIALPFLAMWIDIGSWWFTKFQPAFAYTVIIGGVLMGFAFGAQVFISLYEMWLKRNESVPERENGNE